MKKLLLICFLIVCLTSKAQTNLVTNPSFEQYTSCPSSAGSIYKAVGWDSFRESPDYFNACAPAGTLGVPYTGFSYQYAAEGSAYAGIITYNSGIFSREVLGDSLSSPLIPSQKYYLSFKINRADDPNVVGYSINKIGAKFTTLKLNPLTINNDAQIYTNSIITDTSSWLRISGSFVADSAYKFLLIGNFFDDLNMSIINQSTGPWAYYHIDEVCLSTDSVYCANYITSITEIHNTHETEIFPNPADYEVSIWNDIGSEVAVYNSLGQKILPILKTKGTKSIINTSEWKNGIYFLTINNQSYKLIIHH